MFNCNNGGAHLPKASGHLKLGLFNFEKAKY